MIHFNTVNKLIKELMVVDQHLREVLWTAQEHELNEVQELTQEAMEQLEKVREIVRTTPYRR